MDFSEAYKFSGPEPVFSPDGRYLATSVDSRCVIRDSDSLAVVQIFSCADKIDKIAWSPNNTHVLCALYHRSLLHVWSLDDASWICKIDEGPAGISNAMWAPTGSELLVIADFNIRMSLWSLPTRKCRHMGGPKASGRGICYSPDGTLLAVIERENLKDYLAVYDTLSDSEPARFTLRTNDAADCAWAPNGHALAVWDTQLTYAVYVYTPGGELLAEYKAYEGGLGVRCVTWSPSSQFLAIGSYDQTVRVLNNVTWKPSAEFEHPSRVSDEDAVVFQEVLDTPHLSNSGGSGVGYSDGHNDENAGPGADPQRRRYNVCDVPVEIPAAAAQEGVAKGAPQMGVQSCVFSASGSYLATVSSSSPSAVWVWDMHTLGAACVLLHERPVTAAVWEPQEDRLAICTGCKRLHFWTPDGASCVHTPLQSLHASSITWKTDASSATVCGKESFCVVYLSQ